MRSVATKLALAALMLAAAAPAAADDGRRHVMTPTQKIDLVRDLPEIPAFERDGAYFDLGYIYPIHTVNGASVAGGNGESGYVLYHDDMYAKVDDGTMRDLEFALGEDPTQGYTPPRLSGGSQASAADPWGANGAAGTTNGQPLAAPPPAHRSGGGAVGALGVFFLFFLVLFLRVRLFRDLVVGGMLAGIAAVVRRHNAPEVASGPAGPDTASQAAAQRARLDALSGTPASVAGTARGFGRKGA